MIIASIVSIDSISFLVFRVALSNIVATGHMGLFKCKLIKIT